MDRLLSRREASEAVGDLGWRLVLGSLCTTVPVGSLNSAAAVGARAVEACGEHADDHLRLDLRPDRVLLTLQNRSVVAVTETDAALAGLISVAVGELGLATTPAAGLGARSPQELEIAVDALDIAAVRPFWKAVLDYVNERIDAGPEDALVDRWGQGPRVWFQQMSEPRPQRNRIHVDICVPHDEAQARIAAALAAGGHLISGERAPAFWVLADHEGNEACISTWQGRDP